MDDHPNADERRTPNPEHLAKLKEGVEAWNDWRREHPDVIPQLREARLICKHLEGADLEGADLKGALLSGARLKKARLEGADLRGAHLDGAHLEEAHLGLGPVIETSAEGKFTLDGPRVPTRLVRAQLPRAHLDGADLTGADLEEANLEGANLEAADFTGARLRGATLAYARTDGTVLSEVKWRAEDGSFPDPAKYEGFDVRGVRYSDPLFDQFVRQSEFIRRCRETWPRWLFWLWEQTCDCGRSLQRCLLTCALIVLDFGLCFDAAAKVGCPLVQPTPDSVATWLTPFYFSVVTFSTLGFGDVTPCNIVGQLVVMLEVLLGYAMLGGAISIFTTKFIPPH